MYPTLSDLLKAIFGFYIPLPVQTFGFVMFLAFLLAYWVLSLELKRKEAHGLLHPTPYQVTTGKAASVSELIINGLLGFLFFFKLPLIISAYHAFTENPAQTIFNWDGNLLAGIGGALLAGGLTWYDRKRHAQDKPVTKEENVYPHQLMGNVIIIAAAAGLVGAKIFDNLENWDRFISDPVGNLFSASGLTFYGGMIFGGAAVLWYMNRHGVKPATMLDVGAPGLMLGYGFGRIGCHLSGDGDWGIANNLPKPTWLGFTPDWFWRYSYPHNVNDEGVPIPGCLTRHCHVLSPPVFPTPLYEAVVCILLFFLIWSIRKRIRVPGALFSIYLIMNGVERFLVELIRVNTRYHIGSLSFTQAELISILMFMAGIGGLVYCYYFRRPNTSLNTVMDIPPQSSAIKSSRPTF